MPPDSAPTAASTLIRNARVVTPHPPEAAEVDHTGAPLGRGGAAMRSILNALMDVRFGETVVQLAPAGTLQPRSDETTIDADGRVLMPGFIDCHTHACWPGDESHRVDEWESKLTGSGAHGGDYLKTLQSGGGILATVRAVRAASLGDLRDATLARVLRAAETGTTTIEVKSGYGLSTRDELKMLGAIREAAAIASHRYGLTVIPTALLGHAIDPEVPDFIDRTVRETLPEVARAFPGIAIDAYCEKNAWSVDDTARLFEAALLRGCTLRLHSDQFNSLGGTPLAVALGARSVDHLEASSPEDLAAIAGSQTIGVGLPICGLHWTGHKDSTYAPLRSLIDRGGAVAIATNCNPGSAPCTSMPLALAMAVRGCGLGVQEALTAGTYNPAAVLGLASRGFIAPGARADLILLRTREVRTVMQMLGHNPVATVWAGGRRFTGPM